WGGGEWSWRRRLAPAELPAASRHEPDTLAPPSSGPEYVAEVHESIPEVASVPAKATATGWLYQPFASGARPALALTFGGVPSYFSATVDDDVQPAPSVQVPGTEAEALSGPLYVVDEHVTPDRLSVPLNVNATAWLYQPFASGARAGLAPVTVGGVVSILIVTGSLIVCCGSASTEHLKDLPAVSVSIVCVSHPVTFCPE